MTSREAATDEPTNALEYHHLVWGELIYGSKDDLEALGLAPGRKFPGEAGGPKRELNVIDPRGFTTKIGLAYERNRYCASITFPGRRRERQRTDFAPGVHKYTDLHLRDEYIGSAKALADAGLVRLDQLPGRPGMRKIRVVIFADGTIPGGPPTVRHARGDEPGAKVIERSSTKTYRVMINVAEAESDRRLEAGRLADREYEARMRALPRPVPLDAPACKLPGRVSGSLLLTWSAEDTAAPTKTRQKPAGATKKSCPSLAATSKVVDLREVRVARDFEQRKLAHMAHENLLDEKGERRHLLWVSERESRLLSTILGGRVDEAVAMVKTLMGR